MERQAQCSGVSLAYAGTINGDNAALGENILYGADLAVKLHNQANPGLPGRAEAVRH
jgi:branched-chain amino acid transport system substrate-binding protein